MKIDNEEVYDYFKLKNNINYTTESIGKLPRKIKKIFYNEKENLLENNSTILSKHELKNLYLNNCKIRKYKKIYYPKLSWDEKYERISSCKKHEKIWGNIVNIEKGVSKCPYYCINYKLLNSKEILIIGENYFSVIQKMVSDSINNYCFGGAVICAESLEEYKKKKIELEFNKKNLEPQKIYSILGYTIYVYEYRGYIGIKLGYKNCIFFTSIEETEKEALQQVNIIISVLNNQLKSKKITNDFKIILANNIMNFKEDKVNLDLYTSEMLEKLGLYIFGKE